MKHKSPILILILLLAASVTAFSADNEDPPQVPLSGDWTTPACDSISGSFYVSFTSDEGLTLAARKPAKPMFYTGGLAALDEGSTLLAATRTISGTTILRSQDAGCTWETIANWARQYEVLTITPAPGGLAYAWSRGDPVLYRIEGDRITSLYPPFIVLGLAVDPQDALHIRLGSVDCQLWESFDGGVTFQKLGQAANTGNTASTFFTVEFNPQDWDCALCGTRGAWRTDDAGQTWNTIPPFDKEDVDLVHCFAFSPDDPSRVWARGTMESVANRSREILISNDGGASFTSVLKQYEEVADQNGVVRKLTFKTWAPLAARPGNPDLLYIPFGSYFQDYGTDLWRYDAGNDDLRVVHIDGLDDIHSIDFNPADPQVMYLGLGNAHATEEDVDYAAKTGPKPIAVSVSPNPFNPTANIRFSLPEAARVRLEIFNIAGQKVSTLVDGHLNAGPHTYFWDGSRFASGVYLYRLQAGENVNTEKMVLLK
ncbi:MAG: T9SS type A sorting domain-containing protein [Candidatus Zixiibacteriota bacterium]|nr:MAG: T9SS type A sorting domain-containing protein [candidate division Zixibacteria bacterium]